MPSTDRTILVTGATGRQGGAVASRLLTEGWKVRALVRDTASGPAKALTASGVEIAVGDLDDRDSLDRALKGAWGVFAVHAGSYEGNLYGYDAGHEARTAAKLGAAARAAGVAHVVHSSVIGTGTPLETKLPMLGLKAAAETAWRETGLSSTILRPGSFMENAFDSPRELQDGKLVTGLWAETHEPLIAVADIAAFTALAFADPERHRGKSYVLAGDNLTQLEIAALIGRVAGREVPYVEIPIEQMFEANPTVATMLKALNETPLEVDIPALRAVHPRLHTYEDWLRGTGKPLVDAYFARLEPGEDTAA